MDKNEYINLYRKEKTINFVGFAISQWHITSIEACVKLLSKQGICLEGFLFIRDKKTIGMEYTIDLTKYDFVSELKNIKKYIISFDNETTGLSNKIKSIFDTGKYLLFKKNKKRNIYVFCPCMPNYKQIPIIYNSIPGAKIIFVLFNEGTGSVEYNTFHSQFILINRSNKNLICKLINLIRCAIRFIINNVILLILNNDIINLDLFTMKNKKVVVNKEVIPYYKEVFKDKSNRNNHYSDSCLVVSQSLFSLYGKYYDIEKSLFEFCSSIIVSNKRKCMIKPHPKEQDLSRLEKYKDCIVDNQRDTNFEFLIESSTHKPKCIISIYSTCLVTANIFFSLPTISLAKIVMKECDIPEVKKSCNNFINKFKDFAFFPENREELKTLLEGILNEQK